MTTQSGTGSPISGNELIAQIRRALQELGGADASSDDAVKQVLLALSASSEPPLDQPAPKPSIEDDLDRLGDGAKQLAHLSRDIESGDEDWDLPITPARTRWWNSKWDDPSFARYTLADPLENRNVDWEIPKPGERPTKDDFIYRQGASQWDYRYLRPGVTWLKIESATGFPQPELGREYEAPLKASGGQTPYTWRISGALPPGITLDPAGRLHGTPQPAEGRAQDFSFKLTVSDSGDPPQEASDLIPRHLRLPAAPQPSPSAGKPASPRKGLAGMFKRKPVKEGQDERVPVPPGPAVLKDVSETDLKDPHAFFRANWRNIDQANLQSLLKASAPVAFLVGFNGEVLLVGSQAAKYEQVARKAFQHLVSGTLTRSKATFTPRYDRKVSPSAEALVNQLIKEAARGSTRR